MSPKENSRKKIKSKRSSSLAPQTPQDSQSPQIGTDPAVLTKIGTVLFTFGYLFIVLGLILLTLVYYPTIRAELSYWITKPNPAAVVELASKNNGKNVIHPVDAEFGIVIPKISANANIVPQVDPYNSRIYQTALTKGVAQAKGTTMPDETGNIFLFSHSSVDFYEAARFNSIFYLLDKIEKGDKIYIFYRQQKYTYTVTDTKIVEASDVHYLNQETEDRTLTLMTCWPAGTSLKRLLVFGKQE